MPSLSCAPSLTSDHTSFAAAQTAPLAHSVKAVSKKIDEKDVRDALARRTLGEIEWGTPAGSIDVFTKDEVIEIKHYRNWKSGVGQVKAYGEYYPLHKKRLHLFAREGDRASKYFEMATKLCVKEGIRVTFEEVVSGNNNLGVDVVDGTDVFAISKATAVPLPTTMAELMEWHDMQNKYPSETPESCLKRLRMKALSTEKASATSAAPRVTPADNVTTTKAGEKRKNGECKLDKETGKRQKKELTPGMRLRADMLRDMHPHFVKVAREVWSDKTQPQCRSVMVDGKEKNTVAYLLRMACRNPTSLLEDRVKKKMLSAEPTFCRKFYETFEGKRGNKKLMSYPLKLDSSSWPKWVEDC